MVTKQNVLLAPYTTFKIGGPAKFFADACSAIELAEAFEFAEDKKLPIYVLGGGSNVIFSDKGFPGLVVRILDGGIKINGKKILAGGGMSLLDVVRSAAAASLKGIENLAGIPGSFGGAIRGNAGAFGTEIGDVVSVVKVLERKTGLVKEYGKDECGFGYRMSIFKMNPDFVILSAELQLATGERESLERIITETMAKREAKHPQDAKCAGSFFMNPFITDERLLQEFEKDTGMPSKDGKLPAGWLIDHVGLRGKKIGGAMVSEKHPNYLLNTGNATAEDVMTLASLIKTRVRDQLRVKLQEEVQYVGFGS